MSNINSIRWVLISEAQNTPTFWDVLINNVSIRELTNDSNVTPIGWGNKPEQKNAINRFRLKEKSNLESGQIELLVCSECGDIGCGALTVSINEKDGYIIWDKFLYENGFDTIDFDNCENIGPFKFSRNAYFHSFNSIKL